MLDTRKASLVAALGGLMVVRLVVFENAGFFPVRFDCAKNLRLYKQCMD